VQHDWEQFELLAGELAAQLAAALRAPHANAPTAGQHTAPAQGMLVQAAAETAPGVDLQAAEAGQQQQQLWQGSSAVLPTAAAMLGGGSRGGNSLGLNTGAELAGVLSRLMGAPLATR
jgi:hypothetical protein